MLDPLIFDTPISRSVKVMGTSTTTNPLFTLRQVISIWKQ
ncbi:apolipoN-acyltransferase domain protein [Mycobacterium ulcerans str. Harvey]|uniref:ApolipoN-acyltransferase domain protein n=1 Tax=Mycobacterium ulcerans str. Harvey TaxID=1299332 RepID=A0ABP3AK07_MYCUL|nr:apolipoN-acyltransferase domain protein [Mycobacterium ulcerans str. Harvey]